MSSYFFNLQSGCYGAVIITEGPVLVQHAQPGVHALAPITCDQIRDHRH